MTIAWTIWEILINFIECYFFSYLLVRQLGYTTAQKKWVIIGLSIMVTLESIINFAVQNFIITIFVMFFIMISYAITCFNGKITTKILWGISGTLVTQSANLILSNVLPLFSGLNIVDTLSPSFARLGVQIFYILIVSVIYWSLSRIKRKKTVILPISYNIAIILIMIIGVYSVGRIVGFAIQQNRSIEDRHMLVILSAITFVMLITSMIIFDKMGKTIYDKIQMDAYLQISALEEESIKHSKEMIDIWKHDTHNYIDILQYYANCGDISGIQKHLGTMRESFEAISVLQTTGYSAIDASIYSKLIVARSNNISVSLNISKISGCPIKESELGVILGNLFINAIEACNCIDDPDNRYIEFSIFQLRDMIYIDILNSSNGNYFFKNGTLISSKNEPNHGLGLSSMERKLKKFDVLYEIDPAKDYFQVKLFIPSINTKGGIS